jgi:hypothetical protein
MADKPRNNEYEDKIYTDEKGKPYQGQRFIIPPYDTERLKRELNAGDDSIEVWYKDGKLHGDPAIEYPDGLAEEWDNGKFVKTMRLPFHLRLRNR